MSDDRSVEVGRKSAVLAVHPKPSKLIARLLWYVRVYGHRLRVAAKSPKWWFNNLVFFGVWVMIGLPLYASQHAARGVLYTLGLCILKFGTARRMSGANAMQLVSKDYLARKTLFFRLILESRKGHTMTPDGIQRFQRDALDLIAMFVRSHRDDASGTEIFVNLLVIDGDSVVVLARNHEHRVPLARYPKAGMIAAQAIEQGLVAFTGDVVKDWGVNGKPYKSILVLPVRSESAVLGAVSIDSSRAHHFDIEHRELERYLNPYVALLVWTLEQNVAMVRNVSAASGG